MSEFNSGFEEHGVTVEHFMPGADGVYIKRVNIPAGKRLEMHVHTFEHKSVLAAGAGLLEVDGEVRQVVAPAVLQVKAGKAHAFTSTADSVWLCVHATSETDPARIDHKLVGEN